MKVKTGELTGAALDWAVAKCEGVKVKQIRGLSLWSSANWKQYSTDWSQGGPILDREKINTNHENGVWWATYDSYDSVKWDLAAAEGPTRLIAGMRCYVESKLGKEVDIPEELA